MTNLREPMMVMFADILQWNKYPQRKHTSTGKSLWIGSSYCSKRVQLECVEAALGWDIRAEGETGRSSCLETKFPITEGRETLRDCNELQQQKVKRNISSLLAALKASSSLRDLESGKKIHADAIQSGDDSNTYVANTLVGMYAKCGSLEDAHGVFDRMLCHNVVSWNVLMLGYAENGESEVALQLFERMVFDGCAPNHVTFLAALKACSSLAAKEEGKQVDGKVVKTGSLKKGMAIHSQAAKSGYDSHVYVASTLVDMYAKCGSMGDACGVFERMPHQNVVSWNALMLGYAENGEGEVALQLFARMQFEGCAPDARTCVAALKALTSLAPKEERKHVEEGKLVRMGSLERGMVIHSQAAKSGCESDIYVASTLVDMYAKCGSMEDARPVFDRMPCHDVVSWSAIILGYAENGEGNVALQLFTCIPEGGARDARTFVAVLKACTSLAAEEEGKQVHEKLVKMGSLENGMAIHSQAVKSSCDADIFVANTLVDMYAKCGSMVDARGVFDRMPRHDVVSWNALMLGYAENAEGEVALQLFPCMQNEGYAPDSLTFVAALKACGSVAAKEQGKQVVGKLVKMGSLEKGMAIHSEVAKSSCHSNIYVTSTLVDMYAKCGSMVDACGVFDRMLCHDVVSWSAIILGYAENGEGEFALHLFARIRPEGYAPDPLIFVAALKACGSVAAKEESKQVDGKLVKMGSLEKVVAIHSQAAMSGCDSDIFVASTLIDIYAKCGSMVDARSVFDRMQRHNVVSWTALMLGFAENGDSGVALQLFARMQPEGCAPNALTFVAALKACGSLAALEIGKTIHSEIRRCGLEGNAVVANSLVNFYGKCGSMVDAQQVFDSLTTSDLVTWTALIGGYSRLGDTKHVFDLFERMEKEQVQPNGITFLSVLTACSHAGLVDKGKEYFKAMCSKYGISPAIEHYHCMVDILGRTNQLDDALALVKTMPFKPDVVTWKTVLGACQKWKNLAVGRLAFESLLRLDEEEPAAYVLMANIYGSVGMWEEKSKVQANVQAWKKPGQSLWTDQAGMVHTFVVGDASHPQGEDIHAKLKDLLVKMKEQGYMADVDSMLSDVSDDEECEHSERLAIACALVNTVPGTTIRIVKNLRICGNCHKAIAIISNIEKRAIICRDATQFHVFKDGKCSCGDFW